MPKFPNLRTSLIIVAALLFFMLAGSVQAQGDSNPWSASYWNNAILQGQPAVQRQEGNINYNWGSGSPSPEIDPETFSARWTNTLDLQGGTYQFTTASDDGIRVWVDNQQIIDNWTLHTATVNQAVIQLAPGEHTIRIEYFERSGLAVASFDWERIDPDGDPPGDAPGDETISISPMQGPPGTVISVQASGFTPNAAVTVGIGVAASEPSVEKTVIASPQGSLNTTITLPQDADVGRTWRVLAIDERERALSGDFEVTGDSAVGIGCGETYTVLPGDYLISIAQECNTSVDAILAANPQISNPDVINVGQRLVMPGFSDPADPLVTIAPDSGPAGTQITINGSGFSPTSMVDVGLGVAGSEVSVSQMVRTNLFGAFNTSMTLPDSAEAGQTWRVLVLADDENALSDPFTVTAQATPPPASSPSIFLIAVGDNGQNGMLIGCEDSVIPVQTQIADTDAPLRATLQQLLAIDEQFYGQSGLYNALYQSDLSLLGASIVDGLASVLLTGDLVIGGVCDAPRVEAQLRQTALQFDTVDAVDIFVNGRPISEALGGQG